jgi:cytochrome c-type biogenesis protein
MFSADLAFPFTLGLVAAFNPCGFGMLPVYVSFFLGKDTDSSTARNIMRALKVGLFGAFGILTSSLLSQGSILDYTPYVTFGLGFLLIPFGIAMLRGFELNLSTPRLQKGGDSGEVVSMFFFGVSYAVVSLGCTVGLFIAGVSNVFASGGFIDGVSVFVAYGLGMGAVIMTLTVALALAKTSIAANMRKVLPWVNRISGVLLTLSGAYLIVYGWWEIQILRGNIQQNSLVKFFDRRYSFGFWSAADGWRCADSWPMGSDGQGNPLRRTWRAWPGMGAARSGAELERRTSQPVHFAGHSHGYRFPCPHW